MKLVMDDVIGKRENSVAVCAFCGEYMDFDSVLWHSVNFVFNARKLSYDDVLEW